MPLPHLVIDSERDWIERQLGKLKAMRDRELCIWAYFLGTPCSILELNRIQIGDDPWQPFYRQPATSMLEQNRRQIRAGGGCGAEGANYSRSRAA